MNKLEQDFLSEVSKIPEDTLNQISTKDLEGVSRGALDTKANVYTTTDTAPVGLEFETEFKLSKPTQFLPDFKYEDPRYTQTGYNRLAIIDVLANAQASADTMDSYVSSSKQILEDGGEQDQRLKAYNASIFKETQKLMTNINDGVVDTGVLADSIGLIEKKRREEDEYAMEKAAVEKLQDFAMSNPDWADLRLAHRDIIDEIAEQSKKDLVIRSYLEREKVYEEESGMIGEFFDDAGEILLSLVGDDVISRLRMNGWHLSADYIRQRGQEIRALPIEQIPQALADFHAEVLDKSSILLEDDEDALAALNVAFGDKSVIDSHDMGLAVDTIMTLPFLSGLKAMKATYKATGNVAMAAKDAAKVLSTKEVEGTAYETVESAVVDSMPVSPVTFGSSMSPAIQMEIKTFEEALAAIKNQQGFERLKPEEVGNAVKLRANQLKKIYGKDNIETMNVRFNDEKGVYEMDILIGKRDGTGYSSEASIQGFMSKAKIQGDVVLTENGYFIKQTQNVTESMADQGFTNYKSINVMKRVLQSPKSFVDEFIGNVGTTAAFNEARVHGVVKDIYNKSIGKLKTQEFQEVADILNRGLVEEKWYEPTELRAKFSQRWGKDITEAQEKAYYASQQISDFGYFIQNRAVYQQAAAKGLDSVKLSFTKQGYFNGNVFTDPADFAKQATNARIYDAGKNAVVRGTPEELERLSKQGYLLIRPENPSWTIDEFGEGASFIATKSGKSVEIAPLQFNQLNYLAGGRRVYSEPFFIGQRRTGTFSDGTKYQLAPSIFRSAPTRGEAESWIAKHDEANKIILAVREGKVAASEADDTIRLLTGKNTREYEEFLEEEGINPSVKLEYKKDREDFPMSEEDFEKSDMIRMYNPEAIESGFGTPRTGRLSARGEKLKSVNEADAPVLDFISALNESTDQAIKMGVYNDFKIGSVNRFNTSFRKYMEDADRMTPYELATKGVIKESLKKSNPKLYNAIKGHQFYINSLLRNRTEWDEFIQTQVDKFATSVEGLGDTGKTISTRIHASGANPIEKIRSINYDLNLGMFNPRQLFQQANSAVVGISLDPKNGMLAMKEVPLMRYALIANDNLTTVALGNIASKLAGKNADEIIKSVEQFRRLGFNDFGTGLAMMDAQNTLGATTNRLASKIARTREAGRIFFQEGERYGRLTAYSIARHKYADKFPGKDMFSKEADNWIRVETDRLLLSPNSDNNQLFTKGAASIPTQFWSYMGKLSDAILTGSNGRYTPAERFKLVAGQALFYGSAGIPLADYALDSAEKSSGVTFDPVAAKMLHNGLIDTMLFVVSGGEYNTDFSASSGLGGFWSQMMQNLSENPISTVVGGATGSNLSGAMKAMSNTANVYGLWTNPNPEAVTMTALAGVGSLVKSLSVATQAMMAYNTGIWFDKYGRPLAGVTKGEAIASIGGFNPQVISDVYKILSDDKAATQQYVDEVASVLQQLYIRYNNAETDVERQEIQDLVNALSITSMQSGYSKLAADKFMMFTKSKTYYDALILKQTEKVQSGMYGTNTNLLTIEQREELSRENK